MVSIEEKIEELVYQEYGNMKSSRRYNNRNRLAVRCRDIIHNDWGLSNDNLWKLVDKYVDIMYDVASKRRW